MELVFLQKAAVVEEGAASQSHVAVVVFGLAVQVVGCHWGAAVAAEGKT